MTKIDVTTEKVLSQLDSTVRPQDDLFRHVNGKWFAQTEIPADQVGTGSFQELRNGSEARVREIIEELTAAAAAKDEDGKVVETEADTDQLSAEQQKIADLYISFMSEAEINAQGVLPLAGELAEIQAAQSHEQLAVILGKMLMTGVDAPFGLDIDANRNNPEEYITWISQSGLGLPDEAFYREASYAQIRQAYQEFIPTLYSLACEVDSEEATKAAARIFDFETKLASTHYDVVKLRDAEATNTVLSFADFIASAPGFDWLPCFEALGLSAENAPQLLVYTADQLTKFATLWAETSITDLQYYMVWHTILARSPYLSEPIVQARFNFYGRILSGQEEMRDRWKRGVALVDTVMGEAIGKEYVRRHFPPAYKQQMQQLVADLLSAYEISIKSLDWMTEETKVKALEKLASFVTKIGYPEKWKDYAALSVKQNDLLGNIRNAAMFGWERELEKLGKPIDRSEWHMYPQTVNAYYNPVANEIVFPAAILQPPFFDPQADAAWNYGGIGAVIGHEIGHGFDDQGSKYDGTGRLNNWWTDSDRAEFEKRTAALVGQYDAYKPAQLPADSPHHVQGALTLGENIGDLGGLSIALKAYDIAMKREGYLDGAKGAPEISGLSGLQRVILSYAHIWQGKYRDETAIQLLAVDPHSPVEFRCNGVVKNVDAFAAEFDVKEGDALYLAPEERVRIW
ncbi:M13 family metallopeptidase [Arcanobacterium hippocoleae]|uniref:M13 family metallopeptidase n=1 Tax=Arcanobacterium hippocoleae TaxID=149017 RepID=UPI00333F5E9B